MANVATDSRLVDLRDAVIARLTDTRPDRNVATSGRKVSVAGHPGQFTLDDLRRFQAVWPTVRVSVMGGRGLDSGSSRPVIDCAVAAMVVTGGADPVARDDAGAALAEWVADALHQWTPAVAGVQMLQVHTVELVNSGGEEQQKVAASLWGVVAVAEVAIGDEPGLPDTGPELTPQRLLINCVEVDLDAGANP